MTLTLRLFIVVATGLGVSTLLTPLIIHLAHRNKWYDGKNHRKIHTEDTPRLGGVAIFVGFLVAMAVAFLTSVSDPSGLPSGMQEASQPLSLILYYLPVILGMLTIFMVGLVDDFRDLRAVVKFVIQIAAATLVTLGPFRIESFTVPFVWYQLDLGVFSYPITVFWIVAVANAVNFIDGADGLAGGASAIAALAFAIIAVYLGQSVNALVAIGLFGSLLGFLIYNSPPARIFMGDSGSYILGFGLAVLPLILSDGSGESLNLLPAISILALPIMDVSTSSFRRMRRGTHPFSADREHIHHKLIDLGFEKWQLLSIIYGGGILLGAFAFSWYVLPVNLGTSIQLIVWVAATLLVLLLTRKIKQAARRQE
ncbi:MAG: undecaprenyl/decaprenyl-phosphate alpha-N-acetylglucosaminyl 1-phosphate transferase [Spirochaetales bacterium]|nr:MAG: undecaprenyl/decaprenyl-phosphate alpha-N-acetylglucosaminyl 1-phosphate transferase [Spirochaetales bacterium]